MTAIQNCDVFKDGELYQAGTTVLFKDNGWVRVSVGEMYEFYPPEELDKILKPRP